MTVTEKLELYSIPEPMSGCILWIGATDSNGYGRVNVNGTTMLAHRLSYQIYSGGAGRYLHVLHKCDNPGCINPRHLFRGTDADNVRDKINKGRQPQGSTHYGAILSEDNVREIRQLWKTSGKTQREIGLMYGVTQMTIASLLTGKSWKSVK